MQPFNEKYFSVIAHSLGVSIEKARTSKKRKDRILPKEFYRNRFCAGEGHSDWDTLSEMLSLAMMSCGRPESSLGGAKMWYVTDIGLTYFTFHFYRLFGPKA